VDYSEPVDPGGFYKNVLRPALVAVGLPASRPATKDAPAVTGTCVVRALATARPRGTALFGPVATMHGRVRLDYRFRLKHSQVWLAGWPHKRREVTG